jgi:hypothetical protein
MLRSFARAPAVALAVCVALAGCGGSDVASVSGTLTYKGKPVTNAFVNFVPADGGRPSIGETDPDGKFTLVYDPKVNGAKIGKHRVFVEHNPTADAGKPGAVPGATPQLSPDLKEFFSKYGGDKSTVEVTIDGSESDLKLAWD